MLCRGFLAIVVALGCAQFAQATGSLELDSFERVDGFIDLYWDADSGRIFLEVDNLDRPFIYQSSLPRGVGSNDIGLDRGQLGNTKVVRFVRSGPKILLLEDNLAYRAARLVQSGAPGLVSVTSRLIDASWRQRPSGGMSGVIQRQTNLQVLYSLLELAFNPAADGEVRAIALDAVDGLDRWLSRQSAKDTVLRAHYRFARFEIDRLRSDPSQLEHMSPVSVPPGSPIGSFQTGH